MKASTEKCSEKEVLWNKGAKKTVVKINERYLPGRLLYKVTSIVKLYQYFSFNHRWIHGKGLSEHEIECGEVCDSMWQTVVTFAWRSNWRVELFQWPKYDVDNCIEMEVWEKLGVHLKMGDITPSAHYDHVLSQYNAIWSVYTK